MFCSSNGIVKIFFYPRNIISIYVYKKIKKSKNIIKILFFSFIKLFFKKKSKVLILNTLKYKWAVEIIVFAGVYIKQIYILTI